MDLEFLKKQISCAGPIELLALLAGENIASLSLNPDYFKDEFGQAILQRAKNLIESRKNIKIDNLDQRIAKSVK